MSSNNKCFWADQKTKIAVLVSDFLIGCDIFDLSSVIAKHNPTKLCRKQELSALYKVCLFGPIGKQRWPPNPLIGWDIFDFFYATAERNLRKPYKKQVPKALYQVCVLGRSGKQRWPHWPLIASFFDRKQVLDVLYEVYVFRADRKKDGRLGLWFAEIFSHSTL